MVIENWELWPLFPRLFPLRGSPPWDLQRPGSAWKNPGLLGCPGLHVRPGSSWPPRPSRRRRGGGWRFFKGLLESKWAKMLQFGWRILVSSQSTCRFFVFVVLCVCVVCCVSWPVTTRLASDFEHLFSLRCLMLTHCKTAKHVADEQKWRCRWVILGNIIYLYYIYIYTNVYI